MTIEAADADAACAYAFAAMRIDASLGACEAEETTERQKALRRRALAISPCRASTSPSS